MRVDGGFFHEDGACWTPDPLVQISLSVGLLLEEVEDGRSRVGVRDNTRHIVARQFLKGPKIPIH